MAIPAAVQYAPATRPPVLAQTETRQRTLATLEPAEKITFPAEVDSNSPVFWRMSRGLLFMAVINSAPDPHLSAGRDLSMLSFVREASFDSVVNGARWFEAVVPDDNGRLYGFYHNEPAGLCGAREKTAPRIGAARSFDAGRTWKDLGVVLEGSPHEVVCHTDNRYFAGGVGDFSVIRDPTGTFAYVFFSAYGSSISSQGVSVARMLWADRDVPAGRVATWSEGVWRYPEPTETGWDHAPPSPILPARESWHNPRRTVDAFWGPSVHWNTFLNRYVMLLNRASDVDWAQEGIYLSATATIDNPASWSPPQRLLTGGRWYPQVVGLEPGLGTDRLAGQRARFFMHGESEYEIVFNGHTGEARPRQ